MKMIGRVWAAAMFVVAVSAVVVVIAWKLRAASLTERCAWLREPEE